MNIIPDDSTCSYNGYTFGLYTETQGVDANHVWDSANRTIIYTIYTITLRSKIVVDSGNIEAKFLTIRQQLRQPSGEFHYENKGFGGLAINLPGGGARPSAANIDVNWGPRPRTLRWRPLGTPNAAEITWSVEVAIADCTQVKSIFGMLAFNYALSWAIDRSGYTTRTYTGEVRVPGHRAANGTEIADQADYLRESINPQIPYGFRRIPGTFSISSDKTTLHFSITDEEMPLNYPPEGCVDAHASHAITTSQPSVTAWNGSISASYEPSKFTPKEKAFQWFLLLVKSRMERTKLAMAQLVGATAYPIITGWTIQEPEIYGRQTASFSCSYHFAVGLEQAQGGNFNPGKNLKEAVSASGLWLPVPQNDYMRWINSMAKGPANVRGNAGMKFITHDDAIVSFCDEPDRMPSPNANISPRLFEAIQQELQLDYPPPTKSWLRWKNELHFGEIHDAVELKRLQQQAIASGVLPSIIQNRAKPTYEIIMYGHGIRAGYPIPEPKLVGVGGAIAYPLNSRTGLVAWPPSGFNQSVVANYGMPIYHAQWSLRYIMKENPRDKITVPINPLFGALETDGEQLIQPVAGFGIQVPADGKAGGVQEPMWDAQV